MIFVALKSKEGSRVGIKEIAQGIDSPEHFIAKILQDLSRKDLVRSIKGPNGGFYHDEITMQHSLADIVDAVDGNKIFTGCCLGLKQCSETKPCPVHFSYKSIRENMKKMLDEAKIEDFTPELANQLSFLKQ